MKNVIDLAGTFIRVLLNGAQSSATVAAMALPSSPRGEVHISFLYQHRICSCLVEVHPHGHVSLKKVIERNSFARCRYPNGPDGRRERGRPLAETLPECLLQVDI
ncbi:hypothetical protein JTE90_004601 [Oedothorax gibbosus]|uniref:Secreted protein n=1 Tax=Oedothorax gibbosus TaxID=931172 RepID=A0AAV6TWL2_9ARAC|nr:hypothetical protein JTE90_004601 [Oedothorax gibbosus]